MGTNSINEVGPGEFLRVYKEDEYDPRRIWNGLTIQEAFDLEREAYARIGNHSHFPNLIREGEPPYSLVLRDCGASFDRRAIGSVSIPNVAEQIESILDHLETNRIVHVDIKRNNICYDERTQRISLIDFDTIVLDETPLSERLKRHYKPFSKHPRMMQQNDFYRSLSPFL